ncbi:heterokaryon incompatibility protein-domain-containing protein [Bipolaris maydis]|nr:heterokaryon incompatibility protein-domain-containing protein [Bipolaris maydis]
MDVDTPEGQDRENTPRLMQAAANFASQMAAISVSNITCELHEHCDGSCSGDGPVELVPLQVGHNPYRATVGDHIVYDLPLVQNNPTQPPSDDFQYTPMNSNSGEIRVLRLHPTVFRSDVMVTDLITINLGDPHCPNFGALSYDWCGPVFDHAIICNGKRLDINASLNACLKRRRSDWVEKPEFLWVDAICINQMEATELNQQLVSMDDIYRGALIVFIDSGDAPMEYSVGYDLTLRICVVRKMLDERVEDLVDEQLQERVGLPPFSHVEWHHFCVIFTSSWLQRT